MYRSLILKLVLRLLIGRIHPFLRVAIPELSMWKVLNRPLTLRNRRPGDRFRPKGLKGRKKVKGLFY
ncbi:MAG: tRNA lysidine(34) synthetase TilS [Bacillota bacterium]